MSATSNGAYTALEDAAARPGHAARAPRSDLDMDGAGDQQGAPPRAKRRRAQFMMAAGAALVVCALIGVVVVLASSGRGGGGANNGAGSADGSHDDTDGTAAPGPGAGPDDPAAPPGACGRLCRDGDICLAMPGVGNDGVLGHGFDALRGVPLVLPLVRFSCSSPRRAPRSGLVYTVPKEVSLIFDASSEFASSTNAAHSASSFAKHMAVDAGFSAHVGPFFSASVDVRSVHNRLRRRDKYAAAAQTKAVVAWFRAELKGDMAPDPDFAARVRRLPKEYDAKVYQDFVADYGTHLLRGGTFGGEAVVTAYLDSRAAEDKGNDDIRVAASLKFAFASAHASVDRSEGWFSGSSNKSTEFHASFKGGDPTFAAAGGLKHLAKYDEWAKTVPQHPVLVFSNGAKLKSQDLDEAVAELVPDAADRQTLENIRGAVKAYLGGAPFLPEPPCMYVNKSSPTVFCRAADAAPDQYTCCDRGETCSRQSGGCRPFGGFEVTPMRGTGGKSWLHGKFGPGTGRVLVGKRNPDSLCTLSIVHALYGSEEQCSLSPVLSRGGDHSWQVEAQSGQGTFSCGATCVRPQGTSATGEYAGGRSWFGGATLHATAKGSTDKRQGFQAWQTSGGQAARCDVPFLTHVRKLSKANACSVNATGITYSSQHSAFECGARCAHGLPKNVVVLGKANSAHLSGVVSETRLPLFLKESEGFCYLTALAGVYQSDEWCHVFVGAEGEWVLTGRSNQHGFHCQASCVGFAEYQQQ